MKYKLIIAIFILGILGCKKEDTPIASQKQNPKTESQAEYSVNIDGDVYESKNNIQSYATRQKSNGKVDVYLFDGSSDIKIHVTSVNDTAVSRFFYQNKDWTKCEKFDVEFYIDVDFDGKIGGTLNYRVCGDKQLKVFVQFLFIPITEY